MRNTEFKGEVCSHNHSIYLDNIIRKLFQNPKKILAPYIKPGDTTIDLGCGPGYFSMAMAEMVTDTGRVFAVDIQKEMLVKVARKAALGNLNDIIHIHQCTQEKIGLKPGLKADFILAYYMVHETLDKGEFFTQTRELLSPEGRLLVVEPPFHVSGKAFEAMIRTAGENGFFPMERPRGKGGKSVLLAPDPEGDARA